MDMTKVWQYIDEHQEEYIALLEKFVNQPSISAQGIGLREMAELVRQTQESLGAKSELIETCKYPIVSGYLDNGAERTVLLYNHYDVQPPEPLEKWNTDPFKATIQDGRFIARGSADNKGSMLSRYCAIDAYQKVYGKLPVNIRFLAEGGEEIGSPGLLDFVRQHPDRIAADGIIWEGGSKDINHGPLQVALGVKGLCYVELRCKGAKNDMHSKYGAIIESPVWRLVWALASMKNEKEEITIEGLNEAVTPASESDMEALRTIRYDEKGTLENAQQDHFVKHLTGLPLLEKFFYQPALNIAGIQAGYTGDGAKTVLPNYAMAKLDFRICPGQTPELIVDLLRKHLDKHGFSDIEIINFNNTIPYRGSVDSLIAKATIQNVERVYNMPPTIYTTIAGSSGMGVFCQETGIPAVCFGVYNDDSQTHAPNEYIFVDDYIKGIKLSTCVLHDFAEVQ